LLNIAFHPIYQLPLPLKHRFPMEIRFSSQAIDA